jgi:hypothetical protein
MVGSFLDSSFIIENNINGYCIQNSQDLQKVLIYLKNTKDNISYEKNLNLISKFTFSQFFMSCSTVFL